jgi:hypothetical protein
VHSPGATRSYPSGVDVEDPVAAAEQRLARMLAGHAADASAAEAALAVARADQAGEYAARSVGFGVIRAGELYDDGDWQEFVIAITDGTRHAAIVARLSGSAVAGLLARGEDPAEHLLERMRSAVGTLPNDGRRYENVILNHPAMYTA